MGERKAKQRSAYAAGRLVAVIVGVVLAAFTAYAVLDKIVLSHEIDSDLPEQTENLGAIDKYEGGLATLEVISEERNITFTKYRWKSTDITVADLYLESPQQLKSALAYDRFGYNITESPHDMTARLNVDVAMNGDFYGLHDDGYVIRDGVLYRDTPAVTGNRLNSFVMMNDGTCRIIEETEVPAADLMAQGAWQLLSFGPALVVDGKAVITRANYSNGYVHGPCQRSAICWMGGLHYAFAVANGRTVDNLGLAMWDWAEFTEMLGAKVAYNLDGGYTACLFDHTELVTRDTAAPTENAAENWGNRRRTSMRTMSDIVYVKFGDEGTE